MDASCGGCSDCSGCGSVAGYVCDAGICNSVLESSSNYDEDQAALSSSCQCALHRVGDAPVSGFVALSVVWVLARRRRSRSPRR